MKLIHYVMGAFLFLSFVFLVIHIAKSVEVESVSSQFYTIKARGNVLRIYEWTTKSGMKCVGVYAIARKSWGDCEVVSEASE